jgi:O-antigen/teichoic acid export membrane protein
MAPLPLTTRLWNSAVAWSWAFNGLRLASVLALLPLLSHFLSEADFGFYFVLLNLVAVVPLLDLGFLAAVNRSLSYAMGGASELHAHGLESIERNQGAPNYLLLWKLMFATRALYRYLALGVFVLLGAWGTFVVGMKIHETSNPAHAWLAWALTLAGAVFEMYSGWWNAYLRGLNKVLTSSRILAFAFALRFALASGLLLAGAGLLSVPLAVLVSSFLQRQASRHFALCFLSAQPSPPSGRSEVMALLRTLWPNSWRVGVHCLSNYLTPHANMILCLQVLGLSANGQYGLALQIMAILQGMSTVWIQVKWPIMGQHLVRNEFEALRHLMRTRVALQIASFVLMAAIAIPSAPWLLEKLQTGKSVLPPEWMLLLTFNAFLEAHLTTWATFISLGNRLPFLPITVLTNLLSVALSFILLRTTSLGFGALVLGPLLANAAYNYWRWPLEGARMLHTRWWKLMFSKQS